MSVQKPQKSKDAAKKPSRIRTLSVAVLLLAAVGFLLPFAIKRDSLPPAVRNNKAVTSYYNHTRSLMHKADEKMDAGIEDLHKKAQGENAAPAKAPADAAQTGYTSGDREKLDELITKGTPAP